MVESGEDKGTLSSSLPAVYLYGSSLMEADLSVPVTDQALNHMLRWAVLLQGTSRGGANIKEIVRRIDLWGLDMVFVVGGNGGNAAANAIQQEVEHQGVRCVVAGVPKSIDNDILLVSGLVAAVWVL